MSSVEMSQDMLVAERDFLKEEMGMFIEQTEILEKEKTALSQELKEKRELDEFKSLEEECRTEEKVKFSIRPGLIFCPPFVYFQHFYARFSFFYDHMYSHCVNSVQNCRTSCSMKSPA